MHANFLIKIPRRSSLCCVGNEPFLPEMEYMSLLKEEKDHSYIRYDYCLTCWNKLDKQTLKNGIQWLSKLSPKEMPRPKAIHTLAEKALILLRELLRTEENRDEAYVLTIFLERERSIVLRKEALQLDGKKILFYEILETDEAFAIPKIDLGTLSLEEIQKRLAAKLCE